MAWNGSGTFNRLRSWVADAAAAINISSSRMDADTNDIATSGFGNTLTRDGQGIATANLPMGSFRHTGVGNGVARSDYSALGQVQDSTANWIAAAGTIDALTATYVPAVTALIDGQLLFVRAAGANATTTPTLAVNSITPHTITKLGGSALAAGDIKGNLFEAIFRYNLANTRFELLNPATFSGTLGTTTVAGSLNESNVTLASNGTVNIGAAAGNYIYISGTTTITAFDTIAAGAERMVEFQGALTLTHNGTSLILPGAANILTAVGDVAEFRSEGSGNWRCVDYLRAAQPPPPNLSNAPFSAFDPINLRLTASVGSNLLTVAIKTSNGNDPSVDNPVWIPFRDVTLTAGDPVWVQITTALSINTNATGATLATQNNVPFRLWVTAFNNAGTVVLALWHSGSAAAAIALNPLNEATLQSTTAISGSATAAGTFYTPNGTTLTTKAFRILGFVEYSTALVTAGTYNNAPDIVQLMGQGIKKPGDVVQTVYSTTTTATNSSTTSGVGNKVATALTGAITPTSKANLVKVAANGTLGSAASSGNPGNLQIYRTTGTTAIGSTAGANSFGTAASDITVALFVLDNPAANASTQYGVYVWINSGTVAWTFLRTTELGTMTGTMLIEEIMG